MNSVLYFGAVCWSGNINNQDRIRLDTFIQKANGTVRMDHGQSKEVFWQMHTCHHLKISIGEIARELLRQPRTGHWDLCERILGIVMK